MQRETAIAVIRSHEAELKELGAVSVALFGSTARGEAGPNSDVDVAVRLDERFRGFYAFGALDRIKLRLTELLKVNVDVIPEPSEPGPLKTAIDKDRQFAF
ncbi:nucleotidyltransferase domain-containing protein [Hyphomicrobium sp. CS1BSMeth3]|uniref:nucleotidyltransferase family protein n=1 Tax=Hyphomicrobium sp. CS1BSMeth3 TaxID=1892844 RepID=UPI000930A8B0|nr:nucleotidyltransferase domain-containing protein [Hyphomicrobium sp. CS1BSMeth3]